MGTRLRGSVGLYSLSPKNSPILVLENPKEPLFVEKSEQALVISGPNCFYIFSYRVPVVLPFTIPTEL